jgi:hypothetical protein
VIRKIEHYSWDRYAPALSTNLDVVAVRWLSSAVLFFVIKLEVDIQMNRLHTWAGCNIEMKAYQKGKRVFR